MSIRCIIYSMILETDTAKYARDVTALTEDEALEVANFRPSPTCPLSAESSA